MRRGIVASGIVLVASIAFAASMVRAQVAYESVTGTADCVDLTCSPESFGFEGIVWPVEVGPVDENANYVFTETYLAPSEAVAGWDVTVTAAGGSVIVYTWEVTSDPAEPWSTLETLTLGGTETYTFGAGSIDQLVHVTSFSGPFTVELTDPTPPTTTTTTTTTTVPATTTTTTVPATTTTTTEGDTSGYVAPMPLDKFFGPAITAVLGGVFLGVFLAVFSWLGPSLWREVNEDGNSDS